MASTTVFPARFSTTMSSISDCWVRGSRAAVGSSKSSTSGFMTRTLAMATRFFLASGELVGSAIGQVLDVEHCKGVGDAGFDLFAAHAHVQGTEGDLLAHRWREDLGVGVLEDEPHPGAEPPIELFVLELVLTYHLTKGAVGPESGNTSPSRTFNNVDLPHPLAPSNATFSPRRTRRVTPSSAGNLPR